MIWQRKESAWRLWPRLRPRLPCGLVSVSIAGKTAQLLPEASKLPLAVRDARLGLETGVIVRLAHRLIALLKTRDPLRERVHLTKAGAVLVAAQGAAATIAARLAQSPASSSAGKPQ